LPPDRKATYEPDRALDQAGRDADHLVGVLRDTVLRDGGSVPRPPLVVAAYDTELFGHWWFEGVDWLGTVLRAIGDDPGLRTTTLASRLDRHPPATRLHLPESSWGYAKGHASWVTEGTRPMWQRLRDAEVRARDALAGGRGPRDARVQIARELALLTSSDWPFMVTRGNSSGYAADRVADHGDQLHRLCDAIEAGTVDHDEVARVAARDDAPADVTALLAALDPGGERALPAELDVRVT
jgi:1,4-alpha-glucan branching enzyme